MKSRYAADTDVTAEDSPRYYVNGRQVASIVIEVVERRPGERDTPTDMHITVNELPEDRSRP